MVYGLFFVVQLVFKDWRPPMQATTIHTLATMGAFLSGYRSRRCIYVPGSDCWYAQLTQ